MEWRHTTIDRNYNCWWCKMQRKGEDWTLGFATVWRKEWVLLKTYGMWELAIELNVEPGHLIRSAGSPHLILIHESWALLCKPSPVSQSPFALFLFPPPALFFWLGNKLKLWKKVSMTSSKKKKTHTERENSSSNCAVWWPRHVTIETASNLIRREQQLDKLSQSNVKSLQITGAIKTQSQQISANM